jgi:hypothetical protein
MLLISPSQYFNLNLDHSSQLVSKLRAALAVEQQSDVANPVNISTDILSPQFLQDCLMAIRHGKIQAPLGK